MTPPCSECVHMHTSLINPKISCQKRLSFFPLAERNCGKRVGETGHTEGQDSQTDKEDLAFVDKQH